MIGVIRRIARLSLILLLAGSFFGELCAPTSAYARKRTTSRRRKGRGKKKKKPPRPKLPPIKTPEQKLKLLRMIGASMPSRKVGGRIYFTSETLDKELQVQIGLSDSRFAHVIGDAAFARRVYLDLNGRPPTQTELDRFVRNADRNKRKKLIDTLLAGEQFARKWGRFWQTVIFYNTAANKNRINRKALEDWLTKKIKENTGWDEITAELISATGKDKDNGPDNFNLASENKPAKLAAETARVFMGISIQCAECHDHPFDRWKRRQFHEFAAFFARGKYYMKGKKDPTKKTLIPAKFLLGETPPDYLNADYRRVAVAAYLIYNPKNYWFARAYVNRIWSELLGDGFYSVDSLGPDSEVVHKIVVNRLAAMFRYRNFDTKWLFRTIMNSRTYQRDIRTIDSQTDLFTAVRPSRLRSDQVSASVRQALGAKFADKTIVTTFQTDPSIPQRDLEGSIQQALLMMNNRAINAGIRYGPLKKQLVKIRDNRKLLETAFLKIMARRPNEREVARYSSYLRRHGKNRAAAIEDVVWVLLNSTEFITKR